MPLVFLNNVSNTWKDKYIESFVSIGAPYGGAIKTLRMYISGYNLDVFLLDPLSVRDLQRSFPGSALLLPHDGYWNRDEVVILSPSANYSVKDYELLFADLEYHNGIRMQRDTEQIIGRLQPAGRQGVLDIRDKDSDSGNTDLRCCP
jgi:hypothetical protein